VAHAPETGYCYIRRGAGMGPAYPVAQFIEKPPLDVATAVRRVGDYFWNSGMFVFKAERYLAELAAFAPISSTRLGRVPRRQDGSGFVRIDRAEFEKCRSESIDYAVMEKTHDALVCRSMPAGATWAHGPRCSMPAGR